MSQTMAQNRVYPKTLAESVLYNDDTVQSMLDIGVYVTDDTTDTDISKIPIDAQTLNGYTDNDFAKASDLNNLATQYNNIVNSIDRVSNAEDLYNSINTRINNLSTSDINNFPTALKNPSSLTLKKNGNTVVTYDGSEAKEVNLTFSASEVGAAASSHKHTTSDITNFPTALKNPSSLTVKKNGTALTTYDGSSAKEINLTFSASEVGAMPTSGGTFTGTVYFGNSSYYINTSGQANFSRAYGAYYNDYAEYFPRGEETEPGDIIALDESSQIEQYIKATDNSNIPVGVHSDEYAMVIGGENSEDPNVDHSELNIKKYIPVALCGRVYTKVIGKVHIGDLIVPSNIPGVGKAIDSKSNYDPQLVVGRAVETDQNENLRKIKILIRKG